MEDVIAFARSVAIPILEKIEVLPARVFSWTDDVLKNHLFGNPEDAWDSLNDAINYFFVHEDHVK